MKTSLEIKQALVQIAERKGRPHYTAMVVRDVIKAIHNDLPHPLKDEVVGEKLSGFFGLSGMTLVQHEHDQRRIALTDWIRRTGFKQYEVAEMIELHRKTITRMISGQHEITDKNWEKIQKLMELSA